MRNNLVKSRLVVVAALASGALLPPALVTGVACAGEAERAALVIDTGESVTQYCVELGADSVSGLELIVLAGEQHGLTYTLGFGGQAVCMLADVGPDGEDCFEEYPDFWGYWRGDGSGGWTWSSSGAASTTVKDGDVEGWAWGSGDGGDSHPQPPDTEFASVCEVTPAPSPTTEAESEVEASPAPTPTQAAGGDGDRARAGAGKRLRAQGAPDLTRDRRWHDGALVAQAVELSAAAPTPADSPAPSPPALAAAPVAEDGLPAAGVAALAATIALVVAGGWVVRRRP